MTPEEFHDAMISLDLKFGHDPEIAHIKADELLCEVLESLGYGRGLRVYATMKKWYA